MTHRNEQRRERRVAYSGFVRLRGLGEEESVEAEIRNISALGMFVASKKVPRPGASVFCRVILGNDRRIIKGKVAWVAPGAAIADASGHAGAGIEFVDLSKKDSEVLRHVLDATEEAPAPEHAPMADSDSFGHVEVQFEGLGAPVRARARVTEDGIVVTTKLPFLRVGSDVLVRFGNASDPHQTRSGRLQAVSLGSAGADGVPRLLVELAAPQASGEHTEGTAVATWSEIAAPVPPVRIEIDTEPQGGMTLPLGSHRRLMADADLTDPDITPAVDNAPLLADIEVDVASTPHSVPHAPREDGYTAAAAPSPAATVMPPPPSSAVAVIRAATSAVPSIQVNLTPLPESAPRSDLPVGPLTLSPPPVSEPTMRVDGGLSVPHLHRSEGGSAWPWKMLVGAAVAAAAVTFLATRGEDHGVTPSVPPAASEDRGGIRIEPLPTAAARTAPPSSQPQAPAKAAGAAREAAADEGSWRPLADPSWPFTVVAEGQTTTVFIPLTGDLSGARVYDVTKPDGVGALVLGAKLPKDPGKFTVNEAGITQVWAEQRETGLHVRVLFGRNVVDHTATMEADGLRVVATRRP